MAQRLHRRLHQSRGDARAERWQGNGIGVRVKGGRASARGRVSAATGHRERYIVTLCGSEGSHIRHSDERWRGAVSRSRLGCHVTARELESEKAKTAALCIQPCIHSTGTKLRSSRYRFLPYLPPEVMSSGSAARAPSAPELYKDSITARLDC